jgi:orotate phosphoribosyltransferase
MPTELLELTTALLDIDSIYIGEERKTLASGRKSCLYFNVGDKVISFPTVKDMVVDALADTYRLASVSADRIVGVPEGANMLNSSVGDHLGIGQLRIRESQTEDHGMQRGIEGAHGTESDVCIIEDVISTGGSTVGRAAEPLVAAGLKPVAVVSLIDRQFRSQANKDIVRTAGGIVIPTFSYCTTTDIARVLIEGSMVSDAKIRLLEQELEELK